MIYEYKCASCDVQVEFEQKITDKPKKKCPTCGKFSLTRVISCTTFILKGPGWFNSGGY